MLTIEQCKKTLKNTGKKHTDEEIKQIRDFFYQISEAIYLTIKHQKDEKSDIVR